MKIAVLSGGLREWSLDRVLSELVGAGVAGVEIVCGPGGHLDDFTDASLASLRNAIDRRGLEIAGIAASADWRIGNPEIVHVLRAAEKLRLQGARVYAPAFETGRSFSEQLDRVRSDIGALLAVTHGSRAAILLELSHETLAPSPELALRLLDGFDPARVGIVYDPGNMVVEGHLEPAFAVAVIGPHLKHVHAKNKKYVRRNGSWEQRFARVDNGLVDWVKVFQTLRQAGFRGWVSIDHLSGRTTTATLRRDVKALRIALEMGGAA
jgi:sugar phosphate isomerase/epimerase